jgi:2-haloacid dehalogenase
VSLSSDVTRGTTPSAVIFDVNETLIDLRGLEPLFADAGLGPEWINVWLTETQRDGFALCAAGDWAPFSVLGSTVWNRLAPGRDAAELREALRSCALHSDVAAAVTALAEAGIPMVTLTVGDAALAQQAFDRAGLPASAHLSCDAVRRWKPAPEAYHFAVQYLGVETGDAMMIAAHDWDLHGARRAGLQTGWVNRSGRAWSPGFAAPDVAAGSLTELAAQISR